MKPLFLCSVVLGVTCSVHILHAQSISVSPIQQSGLSSYVPAQYSSDNKPFLTSFTDKGEGTGEILVYDENLDLVDHIDMAVPASSMREEAIADEFEFDKGKKEYGVQYNRVPLEELDTYVTNILGHIEYKIEEHGNWAYVIPTSVLPGCEKEGYNNFFEYGLYGNKYPAQAIFLKEYDEIIGGVYYENWRNCYIPIHWGEPVEKERRYDILPFNKFYVEDFNAGANETGGIILTQKLFNSDADYEYIAPLLNEKTEEYFEYIYKLIVYDAYQTGFRILNASGNELQSIVFPEGQKGSVVSLVEIGSKTYLKALVSGSDGNMTLFYNVNRGNSGSRVDTMPVAIRASVEPTVVREGDPVSVKVCDLPSDSGLSVTDIGGRTVYSVDLPEDGTYQIPGSVMHRGMNIVTVKPCDDAPVSTKILVK